MFFLVTVVKLFSKKVYLLYIFAGAVRDAMSNTKRTDTEHPELMLINSCNSYFVNRIK